MKRAYVLQGEGIECELESKRALSSLGFEVFELAVWNALRSPLKSLSDMGPQDWIWIPGGFSFSDHFGSGRLLAHGLRKSGVWDLWLKRGVNILGICNGFQVLCHLQAFGDVSLEPNAKQMGFVNRWVRVRSEGLDENRSLRMPVRHGEGRLTIRTKLQARPFLYYEDFDNGSWNQVAGLRTEIGDSRIIGLMPHPEVALRPIDDPNQAGPEFTEEFRAKVLTPDGDGTWLLRKLLSVGSMSR
jgi:phosphoribosylformylglycinamidine (FGAM) synthase-like amidotransferase family enzyme